MNRMCQSCKRKPADSYVDPIVCADYGYHPDLCKNGMEVCEDCKIEMITNHKNVEGNTCFLIALSVGLGILLSLSFVGYLLFQLITNIF